MMCLRSIAHMYFLLIVLASLFISIDALRGQVSLSMSSADYPICEEITGGTCGLDCNCMSTCDGVCDATAVAAPNGFIADESVTSRQGCIDGERVLCSPKPATNAKNYIPVCTQMKPGECGKGCQCWSSCETHICPDSALAAGRKWFPDNDTSTNEGCRVDYTRIQCNNAAIVPAVLSMLIPIITLLRQ